MIALRAGRVEESVPLLCKRQAELMLRRAQDDRILKRETFAEASRRAAENSEVNSSGALSGLKF